ncbi:GMC oxidoreductase [Wolfiporia cocos MD-104 SS10]|uniref:GMC oxidoreductase n=1 Tax=Wolfiporia cocos (strain MD-104) TaxID=742152 RepID=A0A2H3JNL1_WOLCO|nr:GMC oxidoreductase [Wolfiporia cocos MD-104 SS10]
MANDATTEVDIIIAGGGTCGCVIAGRLAASYPSLRIMVIEAGSSTYNNPAFTQPARLHEHLRPDSTTMKVIVCRESEALDGRASVVSYAQCLGGASSLNFMMYTRPAASDLYDWETVHRNPGWGFRDLLPIFRELETYQVSPGKEIHGYDGPLRVSLSSVESTPLSAEFLTVAAQYDKGRTFTDDPNNFHECNSYARWPKWIDAETGRRSDVPHYYIYNQVYSSNLIIKTESLVKRVIFDGNRAIGVEYILNNRSNPGAPQSVRTALARHMAVVTAGAFGSPAILKRSGIGSARFLQTLGIPTIADLPAVGEDYQDHHAIVVPFYAKDGTETLDRVDFDKAQSKAGCTMDEGRLWSVWLEVCLNDLSYTEYNYQYGNSWIDAGIKLRPSPNELKDIGPDFKERWSQYFAAAPDKSILWFGLLPFNPSRQQLNPVDSNSAEDVYAPQDINPNFLGDKGDPALLRWSYKRSREFARRMPSYTGETLDQHPAFSTNCQARCQAEALPVNVAAPDLQYTPEDDEIIDSWIRATVAATWHPLGTCAMKSRDDGRVVDPRMNVYGIKGLKVADLSIAPENVSANTYSTALVIAEKAAELIMQELDASISDNDKCESSPTDVRARSPTEGGLCFL